MTTDDTREPGGSTSPLDEAQAEYERIYRRLNAKLDEYRADNNRLRSALEERERLFDAMSASSAQHGAQVELQRDQLLTSREHLGISKQIVESIAVQNEIVKALTRAIEHLCDVGRLVAGRM
jgi:transposase